MAFGARVVGPDHQELRFQDLAVTDSRSPEPDDTDGAVSQRLYSEKPFDLQGNTDEQVQGRF